MKYSLKTKLSISYLFNSLIVIILIAICSNIILNKKFDNYIITQQEKENNDIYNSVSNSYSENGNWNINSLNNIGMHALENGLILKIYDENKNTIWDATLHNNGMCVTMLKNMQENTESRYKNFNGSYTQKEFKIILNDGIKGYMYIGYYGPFYLTDNDLYFINTLNEMIIKIAIISAIFSIIVGIIMSRMISKPILEVINLIKKLGLGNYKQTVKNRTTTKEIDEMINTINDLAYILENQENLRNRLTADIAHELRTPLTIVRTHLEAMIDGVWEITNERLESCNTELKRITVIVEDLEKIAEIENLNLNKIEFDINELIINITNNFETELLNKNILLEKNLKANSIIADRDKMGQVLMNILYNAIKYSRENGKISIKTLDFDKKTIIEISDNGIGISKDDLPYVFDRFYRADKSRSRITGGAGIGLSIVKTIVDAHNAEIVVKSKEGEGSSFTIKI